MVGGLILNTSSCWFISDRFSNLVALASADWLNPEEAIGFVKRALQDSDLSVRDQAVATLRIIESQ